MRALDVINDRWGKRRMRMGSVQAQRAPHGSCRCVSDMAVQSQDNANMKSRKLPSVHIKQELCDNVEQSEFIRRGLASIDRSDAASDWIPAEDVIAKLEAKGVAARERRDTHKA